MENDKMGWHLDKRITIGQLITTITLIISLFWWASSVETRFVFVGSEITRIEQKDSIQNKNIEKILGRIERKQDKIFDRIYAERNEK